MYSPVRLPAKAQGTETELLFGLGILALCFFGAHATIHLLHGRWYDILWTCTLSNAVLGLGLLSRRAISVAVGATWLVMGNLTWLADLLTGGDFFVTSVLTHFGGLTIGILGARILGWPRRTWIWATLGMLGMQLMARLVTPPLANVNLAFSIYTGWERYYPSYRAFWLIMSSEALIVYYLTSWLFLRWLRPFANTL